MGRRNVALSGGPGKRPKAANESLAKGKIAGERRDDDHFFGKNAKTRSKKNGNEVWGGDGF